MVTILKKNSLQIISKFLNNHNIELNACDYIYKKVSLDNLIIQNTVMEFNVSLLPHNSSNKRHYLIEITDEVTVWSVEKRYQEIYDLKKHLSEKNNFKFTSFPSKCLVNSYRADILSYRLTWA